MLFYRMNKQNRNDERLGKIPSNQVIVVKGNPLTRSARHGVTGINGKADIKFEGEMAILMDMLEAKKLVAAAKEHQLKQ